MSDKKMDRSLQIDTDGFREWGNKYHMYNRYEATPYNALDTLFEYYTVMEHGRMVDFGCGKGRVSFYIHQRFNVPVLGIEANETTFHEALMNKKTYMKKHGHIKAPITFLHGLAEQYEIEPQDNCFYFFNPFSLHIFKQVIYNILSSIRINQRSVDVLLYYPMPDFNDFLQGETSFQHFQSIKIPNDHGKYGIIEHYRYIEEDLENALL